ncbi:hypothetical protein PR001_g26196 [Phytophthora rubi]|uniref:Uncharacterized protein n=1 Tax=Phytophthora rubi TaxID=129364 RepID=A0A6A3HVV6_9STRA|nr:hypothetical protein PR001_g26196 [Phytophthora rubi]
MTRRLLGSPQDTPDDSAWGPLSEDEADEVAEKNDCAPSEESSSDESIFLLEDDLRARVTAYI